MHQKNRYLKLVGRRDQVLKNLDNKRKELVTLEKRQIAIEKTQVLLQTTAQETQQTFKVHLEDIVQTALDTCFPGQYTFCVEFLLKRSSTVCDIYLEDKNGFRTNPMGAAGGGVVDIISLALRLAIWTLTKPDNVLVLDEPFKWLSAGLRPLAGEMISTLSSKLGIQIIMVTHDDSLVEIADRVFRVKKNRKGRSKVKVLQEDKSA